MTGHPFPVMHGSMWEEPQTLEDCTKTQCHECAYYDPDATPKFHGERAVCDHREALIYAELVR